MNVIIKIILFIFLLVATNLYLLRPGFWFYQDAGFWPKNLHEVYILLIQQFHTFSNTGYYLGFDQGLFNFTRILILSWTSLLFLIFGYSGSQIIFSLSGYVLTFTSFYLFSGIFFSNKNARFILSLLYVFNPLSYSLQGHVFYNAIAPLFIYAFYKYFYASRELRFAYLLLSVFAAYLWISYIRFIQSNFIVIIPYIIYFFFLFKKQLPIKKIVVFIASYLLLFAPIIFSFTSQIIEGSQTAFNYGAIFGKFVISYPMYDAFNLLQSVAPRIYETQFWSSIGMLFFVSLIFLILTFSKKERSGFYFLNLSLVILGITFYGLGNILGDAWYSNLITVFPFVINEPFWGFYVLGMPIIVLIGLLTKERMKYLYGYSFLFIFIAMLPLLNLNDFQLQKFTLSNVPKPYYDNFIKPFSGFPESTYYPFGACWRAQYMEDAQTPTLCPNWGLRYVSAFLGDPRLTSGASYDIAKIENVLTNIDNLRITHNLKNIIVPNDIVKTHGPGPVTDEYEIRQMERSRKMFDNNPHLIRNHNDNFNHYSYKDKDSYDFFIYAPRALAYRKDSQLITDNSLAISDAPVVITQGEQINSSSLQGSEIRYKASITNPTKYYLEISGVDISTPLLLQFNQSFSHAWDIVFIDKNEFEKNKCVSNWSTYSITNSSRCQYKSGLLEPGDISFLGKESVNEQDHMIGNYVGNAWIIRPDEMKRFFNKNTLYVVIIYTKQVYYAYTILISLLALFILIFLSIIQEVRVGLRKNTD